MDRLKLLEGENAALRVCTRHESILVPAAFEELVEVLRKFAPIDFAGITMPDRPLFFRTLVLSSRTSETVLPYRVSLPSVPELYQTLIEQGSPYFVRELSSSSAIDQLAASLGARSYAIYPIRLGPETQPFAVLSLGFEAAFADKTFPPELGIAIGIALAGSVERGLEASRGRRATRILEACRDAMLAWDVDGRIIDLNAAAVEICGASREDLLGSLVTDVLGSIPVAQPNPARYSLLRKDGRRSTVSATVSPVQGDPLVTAHALLRDLSEVLAVEQDAATSLSQLRALTEQHVLLLDNAPLLIFRIDPDTEKLLYLNRHAERLFGISAADALSAPDFLRDLHADVEGTVAFEEALLVAKRGEISAPYEARLALVRSGDAPDSSPSPKPRRSPHKARREGAEPIIARGTIYPILGEGGRVTAIEGILLDVTGEQAARSRLVQADRLATVGMLAAGVAHEINNPAAFMLLGLDALSRHLSRVTLEEPARGTVVQLVEDLRETGRRIVDIARDMRLFASPPSTEIGRPVVVDVARTIESALTITRAQIVEKAEIELAVEENLPPVAMDDGRLGQVLVNVLVNAAQAIGEARETRTIPMKGDRVRISTRAEGNEVVIEVEDTGVGMSESVQKRLFTPFFTTKGPDSGTGLGLAISKEILARAGGTIQAMSPSSLTEPPRGSRFVIRLPAFLDEILRAPRRGPSDAPRVRGRVLIVEDEVLLGRALGEQIGEQHDVRVATGGEEAIEILREQRFEAVLCDLKMPGMGGEGLYRHLQRVDPEQALRFVFMTGVGFGAEIQRFLADGVPVLEKPFTMEQALSTIAKVVGIGPLKQTAS